MCLSFSLYLPTIKSSPTGYPGVTDYLPTLHYNYLHDVLLPRPWNLHTDVMQWQKEVITLKITSSATHCCEWCIISNFMVPQLVKVKNMVTKFVHIQGRCLIPSEYKKNGILHVSSVILIYVTVFSIFTNCDNKATGVPTQYRNPIGFCIFLVELTQSMRIHMGCTAQMWWDSSYVVTTVCICRTSWTTTWGRGGNWFCSIVSHWPS